MGKHVPKDWTGPTTYCRTCGNDAPDVPRKVTQRDADLASQEGPRECTRCMIGRVLHEVVSPEEARALRLELTHEIKDPSLPWKSQQVTA